MSAVRARGELPLRLVLPVAGDIRGVPGVPGLSAAATLAGQLVLGPDLAFLPDGDPSADGGWLAVDVSGAEPVTATPGDLQTVSQAAGALRLAVLEATDALAELDVARWSAGVKALPRRQRVVHLPPDHESSAAALAARCSQLAAILELAGEDAPGGANNAHGAIRRDAALRPLSIAVRQGLMCAYSSIPLSRHLDR